MDGILFTKDYKHFELHTLKGEQLLTFSERFQPGHALSGDIVIYDPIKETCTLVEHAKHPPLAGLVDFCSKTSYGLTRRGHFMYLFTPFNKAYPPMIVGSSHKKDGKNYIGFVEFEEWTSTLPRGVLRHLLGPSGDLQAELKGIQYTYNPYIFTKAMLQCNLLSPCVPIDRIPTPPCTFNIDPLGCRDIDDVLSIQETESYLELWITIADVSCIVKSESDLDLFARKQGQTAYLDGKIIQPMLPPYLSEDQCSLLPGTIRPGVSLVLQCKKEAPYIIQSQKWVLTHVLNTRTYTYEDFTELAEKQNISVEKIQAIAKQILPDCGTDTHKWIEAFMLKYNIEVAKILRGLEQGILRKHKGMDKERWNKYSQWDTSIAHLAVSAAVYCDAKDSEPSHIGLEADMYCHASSPIRRYSDLWNQRFLVAWIQKKTESTQNEISIHWLNQRQKAAKQFERDSFLVKKLLEGPNIVSAILLSQETIKGSEKQKVKLWISDWKRILTWKTDSVKNLLDGLTLQLKYHKNENGRCWKDKLVFQLEGRL